MENRSNMLKFPANLIKKEMIQKIFDKYKDIASISYYADNGWLSLFEQHLIFLKSINIKDISFEVNAKEKFGALRIYTNISFQYNLNEEGSYEYHEDMEYLRKIITNNASELETKSITICEGCGNPGTLIKQGWWKTLCSSCNEKRFIK